MESTPGKAKRKTPPVLQILTGPHKGKQFRLLAPRIVMGRHSSCDVVFKDNPGCSRQHAKITYKDGVHRIESLNAENPVLINNKAVQSHIFQSKDKIKIGNIELLFLETVAFAPSPFPSSRKKTQGPKKKVLNPPRLILIFALLAGLYFYTAEEDKKEEEKLDLQTESKNIGRHRSTQKTQ